MVTGVAVVTVAMTSVLALSHLPLPIKVKFGLLVRIVLLTVVEVQIVVLLSLVEFTNELYEVVV